MSMSGGALSLDGKELPGGGAAAHGQTDYIFHPKDVMTALER